MKNFPSIKKNTDFQEIYKTGRRQSTGLLVMFLTERADGRSRIGISISKKRGNSVVRHGFARKIREIFRLNSSMLNGGYDIVVTARDQAGKASYAQLEKDFIKLLHRHNVIGDNTGNRIEAEK